MSQQQRNYALGSASPIETVSGTFIDTMSLTVSNNCLGRYFEAHLHIYSNNVHKLFKMDTTQMLNLK